METPPLTPNIPSANQRLLALWFRRFKIAIITAFVVFHLFFLFFRGALDLWYDDFTGWLEKQKSLATVRRVFEPVDHVTKRYGNFFAIEQGWKLYSGPIAKSAAFLAARIEFSDGTEDWVYSENEPNPTNFIRLGGWRQRKFEDNLADSPTDNLADSENLPDWSAFARYCLRRWRTAHPHDRRDVSAIVLVSRTIHFPKPSADPCAFAEPEATTVAVFDPDGRLQ